MNLLTEYWEFVPLLVIKSNQVVDDRSENNRGKSGGWELWEDLGPEIRTHFVHTIVGFSEEHRSLIWENKDYVLNSVETHGHGDEKQGSVSVLNSSLILSHVVEEDHAESCCQQGHN